MDGRMGVRYEDMLAARAAGASLPAELHGSSGYFSKPTPDLDPRLFPPGSDKLHPVVRRWLLHTLYGFWQRHYQHPHWWSTAWIAGSGITHQWSGGRAIGTEPGDLDVLIGVDFPTFFQANPTYQGTPPDAMAEQFNDEFRTSLWPQTANEILPTGGAPFEITWYVNPNSADIRNIHPYAAYNLTDGEWTVRPIDLPEDWDPYTHFSQQWWTQVNSEASQARAYVHTFRTLQTEMTSLEPEHPRWLNTLTQMHAVLRNARTLYDSIHGERHNAFGPDGNGYGDYYNFRWQAHKHLGSVQALHQLASLDADVHKDVATRCYGGEILDGTHALRLAQKAAVGRL